MSPSVHGADEGDGALYLGKVVHRRARPKRHMLRYSVFALLVDLDSLQRLDRRLRLFSAGRFNLFSLYARDFGPHDGSALADFIRGRARAAGLEEEVSRIEMLCYPRLLGFAFNPLTVYYVKDVAGNVRMLVYEVHNTFGEHHFYEALPASAAADARLTHVLPKAFYVSPFNTLEGNYRFVIGPPAAEVFTGITLSDAGGSLVTAYFSGRRQELTDATLLRVAMAFPFMTLKVWAGIHWEAVRLWSKGVPLTLWLRKRNGRGDRKAPAGAPPGAL